jgi:hypothetical protein
MINVQKFTAIGFAYHDGIKKESLLSEEQKKHVIEYAFFLLIFLQM